MPRVQSADVLHGAATDHRVLRRPADGDRPPAGDQPPLKGESRLVVFHRDLMDERERAAAGREVGVALARSDQWPESAATALALLEAALEGAA